MAITYNKHIQEVLEEIFKTLDTRWFCNTETTLQNIKAMSDVFKENFSEDPYWSFDTENGEPICLHQNKPIKGKRGYTICHIRIIKNKLPFYTINIFYDEDMKLLTVASYQGCNEPKIIEEENLKSFSFSDLSISLENFRKHLESTLIKAINY